MTDKFDGKLWKWLLANVLGKLVPSAADEDAGKVLKTDGEGGYAWSTDATGRDVPAGGTAGQVLTATGEDDGYGWSALPEVDEVPDASEASDGDVLTADGDGGYAWAAPAGGGGGGWMHYSVTSPMGSGVTQEVTAAELFAAIAAVTNPIVEIVMRFVKTGNPYPFYVGYTHATVYMPDSSVGYGAMYTPAFDVRGSTPGVTYGQVGYMFNPENNKVSIKSATPPGGTYQMGDANQIDIYFRVSSFETFPQ